MASDQRRQGEGVQAVSLNGGTPAAVGNLGYPEYVGPLEDQGQMKEASGDRQRNKSEKKELECGQNKKRGGKIQNNTGGG